LVGKIANWMVIGGALVSADVIASRREPGPLSLVLVTLMTVAPSAARKPKQPARIARLTHRQNRVEDLIV
jgi:hypothetical protein